MPNSEIPGIYSSYEVSSAISGSGSGAIVGIAARAEQGNKAQVYMIDSYAAAVQELGAGSSMAELIKLLLRNGAASVRAVTAAVGADPSTEDYAAAFDVLMSQQDVTIMICDSCEANVHAAMSNAIAGGGESSKYRIGIVEAEGTAVQIAAAAKAINDEHIAMVAPGAVSADGSELSRGRAAAAVAGALASQTDPAVPLNGAQLYGLEGLSLTLSDENINTLIGAGVIPLENVAGSIYAVRGVTTRTAAGGVPDATWKELTTIQIVNNVIPTIKNSLRSRFMRAKNTVQTRGAIRTQTVIELENKLKREIIDGYDSVTVEADSEDPTACVVSFGFVVAHGLNQIHLTAHITV